MLEKENSGNQWVEGEALKNKSWGGGLGKEVSNIGMEIKTRTMALQKRSSRALRGRKR